MRALASAGIDDFSSASSAPATSSTRAGVIRVLVADPHTGALQHLRTLLDDARDVTVVAEVSRSHSEAMAVRLAPHVILTHGFEVSAIRSLVSATSTSRVLVVSSEPEAASLLDALAAGAAGVISFEATREEVLSAVRAVATGQIVLSHDAIAALTAYSREDLPLARAGTRESQQRFALLTRREHSVFRLVAEGYSAPEVGARLSISKKTVETYKKRISEKLGFSHRAEYVRFALELSILSAPRVRHA